MKKNGAISKMLQSDDPAEQERRLSRLMQLANTPVLDVIIRCDPRLPDRQVAVMVLGMDKVPFEVLYQILEDARRVVQEKERADRNGNSALSQAEATKSLTPE